jgi:hypothetical protein
MRQNATRNTNVFLKLAFGDFLLNLQDNSEFWLHWALCTKLNSVALVRDGTIPTERPPLVGEFSANFCG